MLHGKMIFKIEASSSRIDMPRQALDESDGLFGVVICKLERHRGGPLRGYIAMLAVPEVHRGRGIATKLVRMAIDAMIDKDADEVKWTSSTRLSKD